MKSASFYNFCRKELAESLNRAGFESYRAEQLFRAVYKENAADFSNKFIPHLLKTHAEGTFDLALPGKIKEEAVSKMDRTVKVLLELDSPKYSVESVLIREKERNTICVSSQVGCSLSCTFCHTGTQKLLKNLSTSEIISQFMLMHRRHGVIDNVVFMGQGEPLYNWKNVSRAVRILTDSCGIGLSKSKVTISTSGISPLIPKISHELGVQLAISLHATTDPVRSRIMPINNTFNLSSVLTACEEYLKGAKCSNRRISFEYVLLKGINDTISKDAKELVELLKNFPAHVNIIPFNKWPGSEYECSTTQRVIEFDGYLNSHGLRSTIRWSRGEDIMAACGQLRSNDELKGKVKGSLINAN